jgi:catechol 2,3-dioxygenase-like lactoylglutathione lyase family enzyme
MANEVTVPLLPCASIDEMVDFYETLGFRRTYRQTKPNPYVVVRREDWELHFFGIDGFEPADSYGNCIVQVPDIGVVHTAFAAGLRARYGKVPVQGIPRMTRPRPRKNSGNLSGFTVVDPGGNWIRIYPAGDATEARSQGKLAVALDNAVVQGDGRGDVTQAAKILDGALARVTDAPATERVEALAYRAELARRAGDASRAEAALAELRAIPLTAPERAEVAETLRSLDDLS